MDWFSWLSRTTLEPSLIYDYGLTFARNELQLEDARYFNHEFLQSMGISIAKHRLEILKLVKKQEGGATARPNKKLSGVIKKCLRKCMNKFVSREDHHHHHAVKHVPCSMVPVALKLSGPLDGRMHERMMMNSTNSRSPLMPRPLDARFVATTRSPRVSGPLDPRVMVENRSPRLTRPSDATRAETQSPMGYSPYNKPKADFDFDDDDHTLWPSLFQDLKPT
ncbi:hypothetical protein JHK82_036482 [Glycine max]|nr:hypothetical protein JHK82_036482 [Glycine max]